MCFSGIYLDIAALQKSTTINTVFTRILQRRYRKLLQYVSFSGPFSQLQRRVGLSQQTFKFLFSPKISLYSFFLFLFCLPTQVFTSTLLAPKPHSLKISSLTKPSFNSQKTKLQRHQPQKLTLTKLSFLAITKLPHRRRLASFTIATLFKSGHHRLTSSASPSPSPFSPVDKSGSLIKIGF